MDELKKRLNLLKKLTQIQVTLLDGSIERFCATWDQNILELARTRYPQGYRSLTPIRTSRR